MKPVLIYPEDQAQRNQFAVEIFEKHLGAELKAPDYRGSAEFIINRSNDYHIAKFYENKGVRVFNPSFLSKLANDKQLCCDFMQSNGIEIMPTRYKGVPFVKKPKNGSGGKGVLWCENSSDYDDNFVCQKPASDLGRDLRVWIIGGKIITSFLRVNESDFKANYCLGGKAYAYTLNDEEVKTVKKITALVKGDYYGIDFIFDNGKAVFNEIEDTVGARIVYDNSDIDIIGLYCDYIGYIMKNPTQA